jgi:putative DNA primase/helicase
VSAELRNGGSAALHDYLLHLPLGDFAAHTLPPMTEAKAELIELSRDSTTRFALLWLDGLLDGVPLVPAPSEDVYSLYQSWCQRQGIGRAAPLNKFVDALLKKHGFTGGHGKGGRKWCQLTAARKQLSFVFPPGAQGPDDGRSEAAWLGDCVEKFRNAVSDFKGASHGGF